MAASAAELRIDVTDDHRRPLLTRLEVRAPDGRMFQPEGAIRDVMKKARGGKAWYLGSFIVNGRATLNVPPGEYTVVAEHGPEYRRVERRVSAPGAVLIRLAPWIRMRRRGWWSGDMHVHRPLADAPAIAQAEDLNVTVLVNRNKQQLFREWPPENIRRVDDDHWLTLRNAEDERRGGSWIFHSLSEPLRLAPESAWSPPGLEYIRQARAQRPAGAVLPWFDIDMPFWWEVPVVMALAPPDSLDILHNQFMQYGIDQSEYWGRPRDRTRYPGAAGFVDYCLDLYYRYLNLGFHVPPSAGTGSGVVPNPAGYDRIYARLDGAFSLEKWYQAIRDGRGFVTNGPMLFTRKTPGRIAVTVASREPIDRIELVANGRVIQRVAGRARADFRIDETQFSWCAVRAFVKVEDNVRLAHSSPFYLSGHWDASADARYFQAWIDDLIDRTPSDDLKTLYRQARRRYAAPP